MNISNAFPSKYLKADDVKDDDLILTINRVEVESIGQGENESVKPVVYFEETEKGFVLNKTNATTIGKLYSSETDHWTGKRITIFATEVDFQGKQTMALRVRMRAPASNGNGNAPTQAQAPATTYPPLPAFNNDTAEVLRNILANTAKSIEGHQPDEQVTAESGIVDAFKAARDQATARKLQPTIDANKVTSASTHLQAYMAAITLLRACIEHDAPPF